MKMRIRFLLVSAAMVLSCVEYSSATVLGTVDCSRTGSYLGYFSEIEFSIGYPIEIWVDETDLTIDFSNQALSWNVTEGDVGKTLWATSQTHTTFNGFVSFLTNGNDDTMSLVDSVGTTPPGFPINTMYESEYINGIQGGVDFKGYTIDSIALTINELVLSYDADAIISGHYSYDITYTIYGEAVPEPITVLLFGLGALAMRRKLR